MCIEALLVTMRILRTQMGKCRIWSNWKCSGLLPLVVLALTGPEEALWWLLSQLPRHSFCGICGNELEGLALVAWGQKSLPSLAKPFVSHILVRCCSERAAWSLSTPLWHATPAVSGLCWGMCAGTWETALPQQRQPGGSEHPLGFAPGGVSGKGKSNKGFGGMELNQSGMLSGLPLVHLYPVVIDGERQVRCLHW